VRTRHNYFFMRSLYKHNHKLSTALPQAYKQT